MGLTRREPGGHNKLLGDLYQNKSNIRWKHDRNPNI